MPTRIEIRPLGRLANKMIQFLAAWKLQRELGDAEVCNPNLPEWGLQKREVGPPSNAATLVVDRYSAMPFLTLYQLARAGNYGRIIIDNYMQRMDCLPEWRSAAPLFSTADPSYEPHDDELLIHVRSGDLTLGIPHYPLVPADFYERIIKISGLKPVFMGEIEQNLYCEQLRRRFPGATFLQKQSPVQDFQTLRKASHLVVAVSTFSWLAAWLSDAKQIYLPMLGFLNPMHFKGQRGIDLLPADDPRYRFFLFPLHFGIPEVQALRYHTALAERATEISPRQASFLRTRAPLLEVEAPAVDIDEVWYAHEYMDAACEISTGWFAGPLEHYVEVGMRRGYQPLPAGFSEDSSSIDASLTDLSLHQRATQSSVSEFSIGSTAEEDASRAVSGSPLSPYAFHTSHEDHPWWSVDLGEVCQVHQVVVMNRSQDDWLAGRATPLVASSSLDGQLWSPVFTTPDSLIPGRNGKPLVWTAPRPLTARFFRLSVGKPGCLHLQQVRILGLHANLDCSPALGPESKP